MSYGKKFFEKAYAANYSVQEGILTRPDAHGFSRSFFLKPRQPAIGAAIVVHGTGNDALFPNGDLFLDLLQAHIAVYTFDLDGHGKDSSAVLDQKSLFNCLPAAVLACRTALESSDEAVPLPIHLVGQSLGGALALACATAPLPKVTSCVAVATPNGIVVSAATVLREIGALLSKDFWQSAGHWGLADTLPALGGFKRQHFPIRMAGSLNGAIGGRTSPPFSYLTVVDEVLAKARVLLEQSVLTIPTLLIMGSHDPIAPVARAFELMSRLSQGRLITVPSQSHFKLLLSSEVRQHIVSWIKSHSV